MEIDNQEFSLRHIIYSPQSNSAQNSRYDLDLEACSKNSDAFWCKNPGTKILLRRIAE